MKPQGRCENGILIMQSERKVWEEGNVNRGNLYKLKKIINRKNMAMNRKMQFKTAGE